MPLTVTPVNRNLHTRVTFMMLEFEDLFVVLGVAALMNGVGHFVSGALVAGYELRGLTTYFASDEGRDRGKLMLESFLRLIPEQSMRVQVRYEVVEDLGGLLEGYTAA